MGSEEWAAEAGSDCCETFTAHGMAATRDNPSRGKSNALSLGNGDNSDRLAGSRCERTWPVSGKGAGGGMGRTGEGRYMGAGGRAAGSGRAIMAEAGCGADKVDIVGWALSSGGIGGINRAAGAASRINGEAMGRAGKIGWAAGCGNSEAGAIAATGSALAGDVGRAPGSGTDTIKERTALGGREPGRIATAATSGASGGTGAGMAGRMSGDTGAKVDDGCGMAGASGSTGGTEDSRGWRAAGVSITVGAGNCGDKGVTGVAGSRGGSGAEGTGSGGNEAGRGDCVWASCCGYTSRMADWKPSQVLGSGRASRVRVKVSHIRPAV